MAEDESRYAGVDITLWDPTVTDAQLQAAGLSDLEVLRRPFTSPHAVEYTAAPAIAAAKPQLWKVTL